MNNSDKLDDCKKEIRSILIPCQKGCFLQQFHKDYRSIIGRRLPVSEFGFKTDIDFLKSMPDVVKLTFYHGDYHLQGIADEASKHIQSMVARQKPAKLRIPYPRVPRSRSFILPPRFTERKRTPEPTFSQKIVRNEPLLPLPKTFPNKTQSTTNLTPIEEVILLVQNFKNMLALDDVLVEYKRMYNKNLSLSSYGFSSIKECIDEIPELKIVQKKNVDFVVYSTLQQSCSNEAENKINSDDYSARIPTPEVPTKFNSEYIKNEKGRTFTPEVPSALENNNSKSQSCREGNVPDSLRRKLQKVAEKFTEGVYAADFPDYFEAVNLETLNLHSLGYRCLSDLIDEVPDIFTRKSVIGSRKDYIIYPAKTQVSGSSFIDHIVKNLRKIIEAYPEGIRIKEILHAYSINCKDTLHIEDLGFSDLETFLISIKDNIPLRLGFINGEKSVHLKSNQTSMDSFMKRNKHENEVIPSNAVIPDFAYKPMSLPANYDPTTFIPVYLSSVSHPGHLYIQLQSEEHTDDFLKMSKEMETFYYSSKSEAYMMKGVHIKVGASCVAKWPTDDHWYRAKILSIPSMETIKVHYIDYGTTDTIPTYLLRYAKKEFISIPVQALRCCLSFLKPPKNAEKWSVEVRNRILKLCQNVPLMGKFELMPDGIYSVILCDTNGEDDVFLNDLLINENLAEHDSQNTRNIIPASPEPSMKVESPTYHYNLNGLQALQAQYYLKAFATVAPCFAQNESYLALFRHVSMYCPIVDPVQQNTGMPLMPAACPPGFGALQPHMNINTNTLYNTYPNAVANITSPLVSTTDHFIKAPVEQESLPFPKSTEGASLGNGGDDNEIFYDDDEEMFQQFCQTVSFTKIRYVKRVLLGDGYKMHVIVVDSKPYASSGDISHLIWNNKEADYIFRRLQHKEEDIPSLCISEDGSDELFQQLRRFNVKGVQNTTGFKSSVLLFTLKDVIKILNLFGHPSVTLRKKIIEEISNFNPKDLYWQEFSPDAADIDDGDNNTGVTDDDKIERLCLHDLLAMKESIMCRKKTMMTQGNSDNNSKSNEIYKLEKLQMKVLQRIQEIKKICDEFN